MYSRALQIVVVAALLICLICPLIDLFDHWDHALQTGNETEYSLVVLALCIGVGVSLARFVLKFPLLRFAADSIFNLSAHEATSSSGRRLFFVFPIPLSPPSLALRI